MVCGLGDGSQRTCIKIRVISRMVGYLDGRKGPQEVEGTWKFSRSQRVGEWIKTPTIWESFITREDIVDDKGAIRQYKTGN